jgi:haloalkane dehalogenase
VAALPDFPWEARRVPVGAALSMAVIDEGARDAPVVLALHGEPSWSFLYRHVIGDLLEHGLRVVAPDLIGFGRSDKPRALDAYSYAGHVQWLEAGVLDALALQQITLLCQDWGGLLGLRLVAAHPERFRAVVATNTFLPFGAPLPQAFLDWRAYVRAARRVDPGAVVQRGTLTQLPPEVEEAYREPFAVEADLAGVRAFPDLVPDRPEHPDAVLNRSAWDVLRRWERPFITAFADGDPITAGGAEAFQRLIPGAAGMPHRTLHGGHFIQEDAPHELAAAVRDAIRLAGTG